MYSLSLALLRILVRVVARTRLHGRFRHLLHSPFQVVDHGAPVFSIRDIACLAESLLCDFDRHIAAVVFAQCPRVVEHEMGAFGGYGFHWVSARRVCEPCALLFVSLLQIDSINRFDRVPGVMGNC